ncbi:IclR family transcriptional regulator [Zafaria sp. Z1313]|uniref:IclR family transcriptional regulator n=1 Tax=unclassified Zafaria TaxID=2828765 RepID=UPI002E75E381|nr:IclR family transcriptional regulator [Zafaria sp. J156]MEE1622273.1 IclR family transcriptional regulator [Zafaria sp. J156]
MVRSTTPEPGHGANGRPGNGAGEAGGENGGARGASVIVNVVDVLRCFTVEAPVRGVTEIAGEVGLHKSSVSRILATLEQERIVERDEATRKYRLGLGLIAVAGPLLANLDVRRIAFPVLEELRDSTRETVALTVWDGAESISVEQLASPRQVKHTSPMGSRYATGLSASVQVFLAHEDPADVAALIAEGSIEFESGGADVAGYRERLSAVRAAGSAVNYGETSEDEVGVAAPVRDHRGTVVAAVMIAAPRYRVTEDVLASLAAACRRSAEEISVRLGGTAG